MSIQIAIKKLEEIVDTSEVDAGVIFLSGESTFHKETYPQHKIVNSVCVQCGRGELAISPKSLNCSISVYNNQYFSPLGDALIDLHKTLLETQKEHESEIQRLKEEKERFHKLTVEKLNASTFCSQCATRFPKGWDGYQEFLAHLPSCLSHPQNSLHQDLKRAMDMIREERKFSLKPSLKAIHKTFTSNFDYNAQSILSLIQLNLDSLKGYEEDDQEDHLLVKDFLSLQALMLFYMTRKQWDFETVEALLEEHIRTEFGEQDANGPGREAPE